MPTNDEKFRKVGNILAVGYRDSEGDFMHTFKGKPEMFVNETGDMVIIKGAFHFTHHTGFIDRAKKKRGG